jgi:glycosyltransferase involved in cell wall biosynthesis
MRLLFVISSLTGGGAEGVMGTLANQLAAKGHEVTLVSHLRRFVYHIEDNVDLIDCRVWQYDTFKGNFIVRIYKKIANRFLDYKNLKRIIKEKEPELVMSFLLQWLWQIILICKGRIPIVFAHRVAFERKTSNDFITKKILFKMADVLSVTSYYDVAYLHKKYKKVVTVPNPLRYEPITQEEYVKTFDNRKNILACGRIAPQKGFDKLVVAFSKIAELFPDWDIDICGKDGYDDNYSQRLKKVVNELGLDNRVRFIGFHNDIDRVMREHAVFCLSSDNEGFPNVLSEAMAMGCACVSFDIVTGPREIIIDGLDGIIVEDQNVEELSLALKSILENKKMRYYFGMKACENSRRFRSDVIVNKWEQLLNSIIIAYK